MVNNDTSMIDGDEKVWEMVKDIGIQMCLQGPKGTKRNKQDAVSSSSVQYHITNFFLLNCNELASEGHSL